MKGDAGPLIEQFAFSMAFIGRMAEQQLDWLEC